MSRLLEIFAIASVVSDAVSGADLVIHAAAALPSYTPKDIYSISIEGTKSVLAASLARDVPKVIHISSSAVYGLPIKVPTPEDHKRERIDPYNCAKIDAELACENYRSTGMIIPILRPKTFLGKHRLGIFSILFEWADEGRNFPLIGGGHFRNQMLDVEDFVEAIIAVMTLPDQLTNDAFNIAATEFTTLHDDFQAVLDAAGHGKQIISLPKTLSIGVLRALEIAGLSPVYKRLIYKLSRDAYVCTKKSQQTFGFSPCQSNKSSILRTFQWWREEKLKCKLSTIGRTSRAPWKQGALRLAKLVF